MFRYHRNSPQKPSQSRNSGRRQRRRLADGLQSLEKRQLLAGDVLLADSFESGQWAGNWVEDSQNDWFTSSQRSTDGSYAAEIDGRASNATLTLSTPIDLSGYGSAELTFDWLIERGFDSGEYLSLDVSTNGGASWQTDVRRLSGNVDAENTWHSETVDLSSYTTSQLLIRFRSKVSRSNEDANVDNVKITAVPQTPAFPPSIDYADFSDASELNLVGHAASTPDRLRLTPAEASRRGAAWHHDKQLVSVGFETTFQFQITELGGGGSDGFAFVIQNTSNHALGPGGGHNGFHQIPNSLAVEFDTTHGSDESSDSHVSIHSRGTERNSSKQEFSLGSFDTSGFKLNDGNVHTARITYTPGAMSVFLDDLASPALTIPIDLESLLNLDLGRAYVGFTAATGGGWQNHDVLNWSFANLTDTTTTIGIEDSASAEGNAGQSGLEFVIKRFGDLSGSNTVDWVTSTGTATAGVDYVESSGQVTFAPGEADKIVSVSVIGDTTEEEHETFQVDILLSDGSAAIVDGTATGTIQNDETSLAVSDASATEGGNDFQFVETYIQSSATGLNATRSLHLSPDGFLYAGASVPPSVRKYDYDTGTFVGLVAEDVNLESSTYRGFVFGPDGDIYVADNMYERVLRFDGTTGVPKGEFVTSGLGGLDTPKDLAFGSDLNLYVASANSGEVLRYQGPFAAEPGEFMGVVASATNGGLGSPAALTFGTNGDLYISDRSTDSVLRVDSVTGMVDTFVQPGTGGYDASFAGGLQFGPDRTGDGTMDLYASSYNTDSLLVFDGVDGSLAQTILPTGLGGLYRPTGFVVEPDGNLLVASIGGPDKVLRFAENSKAVFTVTLSKPSALPVSVDYTTRDQSANAAEDYVVQGGTLIFPPGVTSRTVSIQTSDDASYDPGETFELVLSDPVSAAIADDTAVGTITDDDPMPINNLPVADDDAYAITEDGVLSVAAPGVLSGDTDADNDPLTASLVSQASNGVVVLEADGSFTYTPAANFNGSDSFTYVANDDLGNSNVATVNLTVTPENDVPTANEQNVSVKENTAKAVTLSGNDIDGDSLSFTVLAGPSSGSLSGTAPNLIYTPNAGFTGGDSFTFIANDGSANSAAATISIDVTDNNAPVADPQAIAVNEDGSVAIGLTGSDQDSDPITFQIVAAPLHGSLAGTAPNLSYTPDANFNGVDSFTFKVNDGTDDSGLATVSLTVNPINDAPTANAQSVSTLEDAQLAITLSGNDIDGDSLGYIIVAGPANGTLVGSGANRTYTPDANFHGGDGFTFKVNDGQVDSAVVTVSIDVTAVNDAPVATADSHPLDQDTTLSVPASGVLGNDVDVDGDSITAVLVTTTGSGSLTLGSNGSFDYTPDPGFVGSDSFSYQVDDGTTSGNTVTVTLTVNAVNVGPNLSHGEVISVGDSWQTVNLATSYTSMVVIATPRYNSGSGPGVVRIRDAAGSRFQVRVDNVGTSAFSGGVHYVVVEEGVYDEAGFKLEAVKYTESQTSSKGGGWGIDTVGYQQSYISPVVVGQVMTANDEDWSVFWASSGSRTSPPSATALNVGKHVAEDPDTARVSETIGYLVIEATQSGTIEGLPFVAGVGGDSIRGVGNGTYQYSYDAMPNAKTAVLSSAGMDGGDGGWAVLRGNNPVPATSGAISLSIDEDQLRDSERNHTTEQVAYFVIDPPIETASEASIAAPVVFNFSARTESVVSQHSKDTEDRPILQSVPQKLALATSGPTSAMLTGRIRAIDSVIADQRESEVHLSDNLLELLAATTSLKHSKS